METSFSKSGALFVEGAEDVPIPNSQLSEYSTLLSEYTVGAGSRPVPIGGSPFTLHFAAAGVAISPGGTLVAATNSTGGTSGANSVFMFSLKTSTPAGTAFSAQRSTAIAEGRRVILASRLTSHRSSVATVTVQLQDRITTSKVWAKVATIKTSTNGSVRTSVRPNYNTNYRWVFAGDAKYTATISRTTTAYVGQTLTITRSTRSVRRGYRAVFYGTVSPSEDGQVVVLYRESLKKVKNTEHHETLTKIVTRWVTIGSAKIKRQKLPNRTIKISYAIAVKLGKDSYTLRARRSATRNNVAGWSTATRFTVS